LEPVEGAPAVEIDQWRPIPDGIGDGIDPFDAGDHAVEPVSAVAHATYSGAATGMGVPFISSARLEARTSAPPLAPCANISALSCARRAGSLSDSSRLKLVDSGLATSRNTRRRSCE